jgi:hypothetical protein
MKQRKLITNNSGLSIRTLFENIDGTYTVFIERIANDGKHIEFSYEMNYGLFCEALRSVNYKKD